MRVQESRKPRTTIIIISTTIATRNSNNKDSNNNDDVKPAADLTPPRQIPKHPICTTRPPSVMRHPNGYYITTFDRRSFITDAPSTSTSSAGGSTASAAVRYFKKATPYPAASKSKSACLMMKPVPKVSL